MAEEEAAVLDTLLELLIIVTLVDVRIAVVLGLLEDVLLYVVQQLLYMLHDAFHGNVLLFQGVSAHDLHHAFFQISGAKYDAYGYSAQFVVGKLETRTLIIAIVIFHAYS